MKKLILTAAVCLLSAPVFAGNVQEQAKDVIKDGVESLKKAKDVATEKKELSAMEKAKAKLNNVEGKTKQDLNDSINKAATKKKEGLKKAL